MIFRPNSIEKFAIEKFLRVIYNLKKIRIDDIKFDETLISIEASSTSTKSNCTGCGKKSCIKHSSYFRKISEISISGYSVMIKIRASRYKCCNSDCARQIFCEQFAELTEKNMRRSLRANDFIKKIVIEVSSKKASYLLGIFGFTLSSSTCLRLVKSIPFPISSSLTCIGIDDWAKRKGMEYGSIIVDSKTGKTVDLVESRNESDIIKWLKKHPEIKYISRDRSQTYASAIRKALPNAIQIADKFHLIKNLSEAIAKDIKSEYKTIRKSAEEITIPNVLKKIMAPTIYDIEAHREIDEVRLAKYKLYTKLQESGMNFTAIAKKTGVHRTTVAKYLNDGIPTIRKKPINNYDEYLDEIYTLCEKQLNPSAIYREVKKNGFKGSPRSFSNWFNQRYPDYRFKWNRNYGIDDIILNRCWALPTFKRLSILVLNKEYGVSKQTGKCSTDRMMVDLLLDKLPFLKKLYERYNSFRCIINGNDVQLLEKWYDEMVNQPQGNMRNFAMGLKKDWDAITNAIRYNWHNSLTEGCINRLKRKKKRDVRPCGI